jgi:hypothetical protein
MRVIIPEQDALRFFQSHDGVMRPGAKDILDSQFPGIRYESRKSWSVDQYGDKHSSWSYAMVFACDEDGIQFKLSYL